LAKRRQEVGENNNLAMEEVCKNIVAAIEAKLLHHQIQII
jgi:hypothetical protein